MGRGGKRRHRSLRAISPFPSVFSEDLYCRDVKTRACLGEDSMHLIHSHTMTGLGKKPFENIVGKGKIACTSNFSFSHNVFYSIRDRNHHF